LRSARHHFHAPWPGSARRWRTSRKGRSRRACVKDLIEEKLFDRRRDLFTDLSVVFMDTTSLSFYGEGGETPGQSTAIARTIAPISSR